jgi:signal transduction histidine kinase
VKISSLTLKNIPLFETLDSSSLKKINKLLKERKFKKGKTIIKEGEKGNSLYIIHQGEVDVLKGIKKESEKVATLKPPSFFGEMSILENKPRSASIVAKKDTILLELRKEDFEELVNKYPKISMEIMKTLSSRIRETDLKLIEDLREKNRQLRKAYKELKDLQKELLRSERLSAIGKVAGGILHDIKNPLSIVKCYAEYIRDNKDIDKFLKDSSKKILDEINVILTMIHELLEFSKGTYKLNKIDINIDTFIKEVANVFMYKLRTKKIELQLGLGANCMCQVDPQKMRRVFSNIISNAYDAMRVGGELTITSSKENKNIEITFEDTGIGLDVESLKNIFEPFYTKGKEKGTGLGMSITKRIIEEHNGSISVESNPGKGTMVTVQIPS